MSKVITYLSSGLVLALPVVVLATEETVGNNIKDLVTSVGTIVDSLVGVLMTLAIIAFFWGLVKYIWNAGDEEKRKDGKWMMIWSVVALFVMVSIWGLVGFIGSAVGIDPNDNSSILGPDQLNPGDNVL